METNLKNFYISDEQSIYLLSANDAKKLRDWVELCKAQLRKMGYTQVEMIGKGAYGFVFVGFNDKGHERVFKFSRITLPQNVRERLEEEGYMLSLLKHENIPAFLEYELIKKQGILVMERGSGYDLHEYLKQYGSLDVHTLIDIAVQLAELIKYLRDFSVVSASGQTEYKPIIHGDIKPSNLVWDVKNKKLSLIDWGSCVFAQLDEYGNPVANNVMELMSADMQNTNAKLGDVYFIGDEQLNGELSSPRFDEQGVASTLYALASNQNNRYGSETIPASSLNLPKAFAQTLDNMLSKDKFIREKAGEQFVSQAKFMTKWQLPKVTQKTVTCYLPIWINQQSAQLETVVYSSRKSFLREQNVDDTLSNVKDAQLEKYYKNYLQGMGDKEKAFVASVSRLSEYPLVGGLAIHWQQDKVLIDSNLNLFDQSFQRSVYQTINNMIDLARSIDLREGTFKACLFDAKNTLHFERKTESDLFKYSNESINFEITDTPDLASGKQHSYFEDGDDPDEKLQLPDVIMQHIVALNEIHHTGCIIFEVLPKHMKIHNYYHLLDVSKYKEFKEHLQQVLKHIHLIKGLGVSGFMKLPYKDAKEFEYQSKRTDEFYPVKLF